MRTRGKDFEYRLVFPMEERARSYESRASRLAALVQPERSIRIDSQQGEDAAPRRTRELRWAGAQWEPGKLRLCLVAQIVSVLPSCVVFLPLW
jgi:hypothetical protein